MRLRHHLKVSPVKFYTNVFLLLYVVYFTTLFSVCTLYSVYDMLISEWWIGKEVKGTFRGLILRYSPGIRLEWLKKPQNPSIRIASLQAEIWARDIWDTK
jgi:hypothetical protein